MSGFAGYAGAPAATGSGLIYDALTLGTRVRLAMHLAVHSFMSYRNVQCRADGLYRGQATRRVADGGMDVVLVTGCKIWRAKSGCPMGSPPESVTPPPERR